MLGAIGKDAQREAAMQERHRHIEHRAVRQSAADNRGEDDRSVRKNHELAKEIEKLQLIISHKDEIINHLKKENQSLYDMISLLKSNHSS